MEAFTSHGAQLMPLSCYACRSRKLKCDRLKPVCNRCASSVETCKYPAERKRPSTNGPRPRVHALELRVKELEDRLKNKNSKADEALDWASDSSPWDLLSTGRHEWPLPQPMVDELTNVYFLKLHSEIPMLHPSRYQASLYLPPYMQPPMCLQYILLAAAALSSTMYNSLARVFYDRSRHYMNMDESKEDGQQGFVTVSHVQCWVLTAAFEARNCWFAKAAMSTSRAVRLSQILGLQDLDSESLFGPTLPPPKDWCEQEERRRTVWATFIMDRDTGATTGWPTLMDPMRIHSLLPVSEESFELGIEEPAITLQEALGSGRAICSAFACRILADHLFQECLDLTYSSRVNIGSPDIQEARFWRRHSELSIGLVTTFATLPDRMRCPQNIHDQHAVFVNLEMHAATICLHRVGIARRKKHSIQGGESFVNARTQLLPSAFEIFNIIVANTDTDTLFKHPFVAFAAYMAAFVFLEDYVGFKTRDSEEKLRTIMELMLVVGNSSLIMASLAVQLAHEVQKTGVDPSAMQKVAKLTYQMQQQGNPPMKHDAGDGIMMLCPFEKPLESVPTGVPALYASAIPAWMRESSDLSL